VATQTALITGASAGIGRELARQLARDMTGIVLVARRRERLDQLADELRQKFGSQTRVIAADLADPSAPPRIIDELQAAGIQVDVLINNAGFGAAGPFCQSDLEQQLAMLQVNVRALTHLTRLVLPGMIQRRQGGIINVGSTAGFQPGPYMAVYYATKAYVLSFSEALAEELRGTGVRVTCLAPGATATEFASAAQMEDSLLFRLGAMNAAEVAQQGYAGFRRGKTLVVPGARNKFGAFAVRFVPRAWVRKLTKRLSWNGPKG